MATRKTTGLPIHELTQGRPVSGLKAVAAKQAKSQAKRTKPPTMSKLPWEQGTNERTTARAADTPTTPEQESDFAQKRNRQIAEK